MTKRQYKLCKYVLRYKKLGKITEKAEIDYLGFQAELNYQLNFSDTELNDNTEVKLKQPLQAEYETYLSDRRRSNLTIGISAVAAIGSAISAAPHIVQWLSTLTQ